MPSKLIQTREDADKLPGSWYTLIEKARDKSRKLLGQVIAVHQTNVVVIGKLTQTDIERLWQVKYPYCKLVVKNGIRYRQSGEVENKLGEEGVLWVNNPDVIMSMEELSKKFPRIHMEVLPKVKMSYW